MRVMKIGRLILAGAGVLMVGGLAAAQGPGGPGMGPGFGQHRPPMERAFGGAGAHGQWWNNPNIVKQLSLTDDQRKAMDGIMQDHRMKLIDLQANLEKAEVTMGPLMKADSPNKEAIEAQIDKVVSARAELEKANARFLLDIRMQLKPDQWKQLQTLHADRMQHGEMHGQERGRWGQDEHGGPRPGMGGPGSQFRRRQGPPPATAPQGAPAPAPAPGSQPSGSGDAQ
jgi:Spy/CpxP family protein refolding chaperone